MKQRERLRVGDRVRFYVAEGRVRGQVTDDLGDLAPGDRQLVRVKYRNVSLAGTKRELVYEIPADWCTK